MSKRLVDELATARSRRRFTASAAVVLALATLVHAITLTFLTVGGWLAIDGSTWPLRALGVVCLLVAIALAPRLQRAPRGPGLLDPERYPETYALVREVAEVVGSRMPTRLQLDTDFNASAGPTGLRGRTLTLGAPLWVACAPQAKVALLAHELGHFAHGDVLQLRYVSSAHDALLAWADIFEPGTMTERAALDAGIAMQHGGGGWVLRPILWPFRMLFLGYLRLIILANGPSHRRQEHYADLAAVRAGGTDGAVDLLETTLAGVGVEVVCNRVGINPARPPLRPALREHMASYDAAARSRQRAHANSETIRIDSSHPPTIERLRLVESVEHTSAAVVLDAARVARLDAEQAEQLDAALTRLADSYRGT